METPFYCLFVWGGANSIYWLFDIEAAFRWLFESAGTNIWGKIGSRKNFSLPKTAGWWLVFHFMAHTLPGGLAVYIRPWLLKYYLHYLHNLAEKRAKLILADIAISVYIINRHASVAVYLYRNTVIHVIHVSCHLFYTHGSLALWLVKNNYKKLAKQRGCLFATINSHFVLRACMYIEIKHNIIGLCHVNIYDHQNKLRLCNFRFADRGQLRNIVGKLVSAHPKLRSRLPMQSKR